MIGKIATFLKNILDWFKSDRCFVSYFVKAFPLANNFVLLTLLLMSIFIITIYMIIAGQIGINSVLSLLIVIMLSSAFGAGFFHSIKHNSDNPDEKITIKSGFSAFYSGIGEYYLSFFGMFILFFILATLIIIGSFFAADKLICGIDQLGISANDFFMILAAPNQMDMIMDNLNPVQQGHLKAWCRFFLFTTQAFTFLIMLWIPEKIYTKRHFFITLFTSIKKIFTDFPNALCVYLMIMLLNYLLAIFIVLLSPFRFIAFLLNICSLYLLILNFYAIFLYYKHKFTEPEQDGWIA